MLHHPDTATKPLARRSRHRDGQPCRPARRRFIACGALSAALLAAGGSLARVAPADRAAMLTGNADAWSVVRAIAPVMLGGLVPPADAASLDRLTRDALAGMDLLPPHARRELAQLFSLMTFAPTRYALLGLSSDWPEAGASAVDEALAGWRDSRMALKRGAYDALHALVLGAWYASPEAWPAIGYPGPPALG